jgi:hypothetical protein
MASYRTSIADHSARRRWAAKCCAHCGDTFLSRGKTPDILIHSGPHAGTVRLLVGSGLTGSVSQAAGLSVAGTSRRLVASAPTDALPTPA